ncbi:glycine cleavage system protein T [Neoasaia chiangmaiensis]|nr:glycine cleavage system protein T [Neoasaia chiangmaiensis]
MWAGFLTPQGRYLADFFVFAEDERLLLDTHETQTDMLVTKLSRFRLRADVQIAATDLTVQAGWDDAGMPARHAAPDPRLPQAGWRAYGPAKETTVRTDTYDQHRIKLGLPDAIDCEPEKTLLLEANFDHLHGISWTKGCYMGQELTARTHYRGLVKRRLLPVESSHPLPPIGSPIMLDDREVGTLRSSVGQHGLAFLRREAWQETLTCDGMALTAVVPDWLKEQDA